MAVQARSSNDKNYRGDGFTTVQHNPKVGLKQLTQWKQIIVEEIMKDEELLKLLYYSTEDCLNRPNLTDEQKQELLDENIYQYRFIDSISNDKKSYISMDFAHFKPFEGFRLFSDDFLHGYLYIYILCDIEIMKTNSGIRTDLISGKVYDIFQGYQGIGIGELRLETQLPLWVDNNHYGGMTLGFMVADFK